MPAVIPIHSRLCVGVLLSILSAAPLLAQPATPVRKDSTARADTARVPQQELDGGYVDLTSGVTARRHFVRDHLGSVRTVVNDAGTVLETDNYYPLGGPLGVLMLLSSGGEVPSRNNFNWI